MTSNGSVCVWCGAPIVTGSELLDEPGDSFVNLFSVALLHNNNLPVPCVDLYRRSLEEVPSRCLS